MRSVRTRLAGLTAGLAGVAVALVTVSAPASAAPSANHGNKVGMSPAVVSPSTINRTNEKTAFDYFVNRGMTKIRAAGIIGNLDQESGMDPTIQQYGGGPGRGIAQWSTGGRWDTYASDNVVCTPRTGRPA